MQFSDLNTIQSPQQNIDSTIISKCSIPPSPSGPPFDIKCIILIADSIQSPEILVKFIGNTIKETKIDFLTGMLKLAGRDFLLKSLEKTLKIMNEGGMRKKKLVDEENVNNPDNFRSIGGTFINVVKESGMFSKDVFKKFFYKNYSSRNKRKKLMKKLSEMSIK